MLEKHSQLATDLDVTPPDPQVLKRRDSTMNRRPVAVMVVIAMTGINSIISNRTAYMPMHVMFHSNQFKTNLESNKIQIQSAHQQHFGL